MAVERGDGPVECGAEIHSQWMRDLEASKFHIFVVGRTPAGLLNVNDIAAVSSTRNRCIKYMTRHKNGVIAYAGVQIAKAT